MRAFLLVCCVILAIALAAGPAAPTKPPAASGASATARKTPSGSTKALPRTSPVVRRWMSGMTLRDEVAQLIFIPFNGAAPNTHSREYRRYERMITQMRVGGLILVNWSNGRVIERAEPYALAAFLNRMQRLSRVPLMVGGDFERGVSMRVDGTTVFPHAMAFGATGNPEFSRFEGEVAAREARALGVHWIYYPVADVNNNPDNPIINVRSFGENPSDVSAHVRAFIEGARANKSAPVLTTVKHFPGHGDTNIDTHLNLATIPGDRERLDRIEMPPFRAAIEAGVDSVMTAHVAVPAISPADLPATLSPAILTDLLRKELGFKGLIVTDALEMGGIAKGFSSGEAAVRAIEAGVDTLLMPSDPEAALNAVVGAVRSGRISRARIRESVARLLTAKERVGLARRRTVNTELIADIIDAPEANEKAQEIADRAVTLVRNSSNAVPLDPARRSCFVIMPESRYSTSGQVFAEEIRKRRKDATISALDPTLPRGAFDEIVSGFGSCDSITVAAFASVGAYRGTTGLTGELPYMMERLIASGKPVILIALGNPYLLRNFPAVASYLATFSSVAPSERAAVKAIFGEIAITGRMPVSIPGYAVYGEGIRLEPRGAQR